MKKITNLKTYSTIKKIKALFWLVLFSLFFVDTYYQRKELGLIKEEKR